MIKGMAMLKMAGCAGSLVALFILFFIMYLYTLSVPLGFLVTGILIVAYILWKKESERTTIEKNNHVQNQKEILLNNKNAINKLLDNIDYDEQAQQYISKPFKSLAVLHHLLGVG